VGRIKAKRKLRTFVFYVCVVLVLLMVMMYWKHIWLTAVGVANTLIETYDALAGR
jgi:CHASE3 domain sensor protein